MATFTAPPAKACTKCHAVKPLEDYRRDKRSTDGRTSTCKACDRAYQQANKERKKAYDREWYAANRDRRRSQSAKYREANRDQIREQTARYNAANRERNAERNAEYHLRNREEIRARQAEYRAENRDRLSAASREWYAANRSRVSARKASTPHIQWESHYRARALRFGFEPVIESFTREQLTARFGDSCVHCGGPFEHLDHYPVAVALGGKHSLDNCVPSCAECNTSPSNSIRAMREEYQA